MLQPMLSLVGAGPGDPELITLKAIKTLSAADVILYDALACEDLLQYARPGTLCLSVGKRPGRHAVPQDEICRLIVHYAQSHGHVVRLKGGDPFLFGRAEEEIRAAREAGIPVQTIPGITSAIAAPASQGIPLTARGLHESCWITTGTTRTGTISADIALAAQSTATVVILMGMSRIREIMDIFITNGKSGIPAAVIQSATTGEERCVTGSVADIAELAEEAGLGSPAVIIIGETVRLHPALWKEYANLTAHSNEPPL
ncbi:uroporphyrinogen-III C-methyltransferase [Chitinophaga deserti]|uniref:uroporphyrinogen-III C-methyltransferase n=1 Tax=Chitinophaga deserti TaxID=2164099 RepID=UPI000D6C45E3|nr:uroporphyrinogen-III C-methyltransferase [Chitinophaga deserti]